MQNVILASTLHDPRGALLGPLNQAVDVVLSNYRGWVFSITSATDDRVKEFLKSQGKPTSPIVPNKIENDHLNALQEALVIAKKMGINQIQYTDGDRMVVAGKYYPKDLSELARLAADIDNTDSYLNLRRSPEDYFAHPPPLVQTELEFNRLYSKAFGIPLDVSSTAHVMSQDLVEEILRRSPQMEPINFPQPKWIIIAKEAGVTIRSVETRNVLTFETPEQYRAQVNTEVTGDYNLLQQAYMATLGVKNYLNPEEWRLRFETERQYIGLLLNNLNVFGFNPQQKESFQDELQRSLKLMGGWQETILETLERSGKGPEQ